MPTFSVAPFHRIASVLLTYLPSGGSAAAAGDLVKQLGGTLAGYLFIVEIPFLKGREKLDQNVPVVTLLDVNE